MSRSTAPSTLKSHVLDEWNCSDLACWQTTLAQSTTWTRKLTYSWVTIPQVINQKRGSCFGHENHGCFRQPLLHGFFSKLSRKKHPLYFKTALTREYCVPVLKNGQQNDDEWLTKSVTKAEIATSGVSVCTMMLIYYRTRDLCIFWLPDICCFWVTRGKTTQGCMSSKFPPNHVFHHIGGSPERFPESVTWGP